jgi:lipoprotein NlpI
MKNKLLSILFLVFMIACGEKQKSESRENVDIEYLNTDEPIVGDFDREKYPILQNAILLKIEGELNESILEFNKAEDEYGSMIQIYLNRGVVYDQLGKLNNAESDFTKCLKIDSTYVPALLNRGLIYAHSERTQKALNDFDSAIDLKPDESACYLNRAVAYKIINEIELACSDLLKAKSLGFDEQYNSEMNYELISELNCE